MKRHFKVALLYVLLSTIASLVIVSINKILAFIGVDIELSVSRFIADRLDYYYSHLIIFPLLGALFGLAIGLLVVFVWHERRMFWDGVPIPMWQFMLSAFLGLCLVFFFPFILDLSRLPENMVMTLLLLLGTTLGYSAPVSAGIFLRKVEV